VHRGPESGTSIRGKGHEPPLTVLAEEALPVLADPVESDDAPLLDDVDGVTVVVVVPADDVLDEVVAPLDFVAAPGLPCAATTASAATAAVANIPKDVVSLRRRRSARSRSATVMRRLEAGDAGVSISRMGSAGAAGWCMRSSLVPPP
jgi:hypothetical protein